MENFLPFSSNLKLLSVNSSSLEESKIYRLGKRLKGWITWRKFNPFPNKPWFLRVCSTSLLKTLWEKEKLLVTSNFSFSHSVFFPFRELPVIFIKFEIVVCKLFQFGRVLSSSFGKGLKRKSTCGMKLHRHWYLILRNMQVYMKIRVSSVRTLCYITKISEKENS